MRKTALLLLLLCAMLLVCGTACAESFTFDGIFATCQVSDDYIILTPQNLELHPEWLENHGATLEAMLDKWQKRGVLVQAWNQEGDMCIEISAVQDQHALDYWDINAVSTDDRFVYRTSHLKDLWYADQGYEYTSTEWKNAAERGRFLLAEYKRVAPGDTYSGYQRRTVRNGYTITLECQVYGRKPKAADSKALDKVLSTWQFTRIVDKPAAAALQPVTTEGGEGAATQQPAVNVAAAAKATLTKVPPMETATGEFKVAGTTEPGAHLIAVLMRMSTPGPTRIELDADQKGKFSMDVKLPSEGVWNMTITVMLGDEVIEEIMFDHVIVYSKTQITINLDAPLPTELTSDKLVISGTTMKGTKVQCIVGTSYEKSVTVNANGTFSFTVDTSAEGTYNIMLTFQKKNYDGRRMIVTATRTLTEADHKARAIASAVKPAYGTLVDKITGYTGRTLTYAMYVTDIVPAAEGQWVIFMAMDYTVKNGYKNYIAVLTNEEPHLEIGSKHRLYGTCMGTWTVQQSGATKIYPCIELLFWDD